MQTRCGSNIVKVVLPTTFLPGIKTLRLLPIPLLTESVDYLQVLYKPEVRGSRLRRRAKAGECVASDSVSSEGLESIRADSFERSYSIQWLNALNRILNDWDSGQSDDSVDDRLALIDKVAALLAGCAGASAAGKVTRRWVFTSQNNPSLTIDLDLTDAPLVNDDYGTVGAQTWGGACVMAEMLVDDPSAFGLGSERIVSCDSNKHPFRILELGAGTGLVGLVTSKVVHAIHSNYSDSPTPEIVLTDFHPIILENLTRNVESNTMLQSQVSVNVERLDWEAFSKSEEDASPNLSTPFDLIFGADIIYEAQHAVWIRDCLIKLLRRNPSSAFHLVIPLRKTHTQESETIEKVFSRESSQLVVLSKETFLCNALAGGYTQRLSSGDEVEYAYYRIGWLQLEYNR